MTNTLTATKPTTKASKAASAQAVPQKGKGRTAKPVVAETKATNNPKCAHARTQKAKPIAKMLRVISKKGSHPGKALRIKRWDAYSKGMTLQHCKETNGLDHLDVLFYVEHGLMELRNATDKEIEVAITEWQASIKK